MAHKNSPKTKMREAERPVNSKTKSNLKAVGKRAQISPVQLQETNLTMISIGPDRHPDRKNSWTANHDRRYNFGANATNFWNFWEGGKWLKVAKLKILGWHTVWVAQKTANYGVWLLETSKLEKARKHNFWWSRGLIVYFCDWKKGGQEKYSTLWAVCASKT